MFTLLLCMASFGQHSGDSIDCSDRIGYSWMKSYGNASSEYVSDLAVDSEGNIFVTGTFSGTLTIDGQSVTSVGNTDFYIAKMTPEGSLLWLRTGGSSAVEQANAIDVDASGNVFVVGLSGDNTSFMGNAFPSLGAKDGFLIKLDNDGNHVFTRTFGCFQDDNANDVAVDGDGNVFVTGYFNYMLQIGNASNYQEARGGDDAFLVKFSNDGDVIWSMNNASSSHDYGKRIACDASGNVYIAGEFKGTVSFGSATLQSPNDRNVYLAKFNSSGTAQWAYQRGATDNDSVMALDVTSAGNIFMAYKQVSGNPLVAKYSTSGASQGTITFPTGMVSINDVLCDSFDNTYIAGKFSGNVDFGRGQVSSSGSTPDYFIVRYAPDGTSDIQFIGAQSYANSLSSLAIDYANNLVAGGSFENSFAMGGNTVSSNGASDALIIKFERYMSFGQTNIVTTNCNPNNISVSVEVEGGTSPFIYYWSNGAMGESMSGMSVGTYSVTVVDSEHCYITTDVILTPPQPPVVDLPNYMTICPSDSVTLHANDGMSAYLWSTGETTSDIIVSDEGIYTVTITSSNSCTASASSNISEYPNIDVLPETDYYFCPDEYLTIETSGFQSYYWSNGINGPTFTTPIEYTFWIRAYNGICYYYDTITTHKYPQPTIELGSDTHFCDGDSVMVTAPSGFESYLWNNGDAGRSVWVAEAGQLKVDAYDTNGCIARDSINVVEIELPHLDLGPDSTYCTDGKVILAPVEPVHGCSSLWSTGEMESSIAVTSSGSYWLRVTNDYGCSSTDTVTISVIRVAPFDLPDELKFCEESAVLSSANRYDAYEWSTGETAPSIEIYHSGIYSVTVTDVSGCTISDQVDVTKNYIDEPFFGNDTVFCGIYSRRLYLNNTYSTYTWNNGTSNPYIDIATPGHYSVSVTNDVGCSSVASMNVNFSDVYPEILNITSGKGLVIVDVQGGTPPYYYSADGVTWQASNIFDNLPSDYYTIQVMDHNYCVDQMQTFLDASIGIPNFFTPNGDGYNDTWVITGLYMYPSSRVSVFDRYGKQVFESQGPVCSWNGMYGGQILPSDSYWYVIYLGEGIVPQKGCVTIKR